VCTALCPIILAAAGLPAFAEELHEFTITAASASSAIHSFAAQSGVQILASGERLEGKRFNDVTGLMSTDAALRRMLAGTGLDYEYVGDRAIALMQPRPETRIASPQRLAYAIAAETSVKDVESRRVDDANIPAQRSAEAVPRFELESIVVTARRREENLQDTPISIAAYSGETLQRRQIFATEDLDQITPNLQFATLAPLSGNNSAAQVFIRGIGQTDATAGVDPGVGVYIDEVYMGSAVGGAMNFRDIADVQVLRGPQGTLFGRNTVGGTLLLTTVEPGDELGGLARLGVGNDNLLEGFLALDAPISETLRTRWTFGKRTRDGYVKRPFDNVLLGDQNNYSVTGKAAWEPNAAFKLSIKTDYTNADENGAPLVFAAINESQPFPRVVSLQAGCPGMANVNVAVPQIDDRRCANDYWNDGHDTANGTQPLQSTLENWGVAAVAQWNAADALAFKSITAYRELNWNGNRDADNTPFPILHTVYASNGDQFSQELQALVQSSKLSGVLGLYYFRQSVDDKLFVTLAPPHAPGGTQDSNDNLIENYNWAAFTQWTYALTDALSLAGGVRYTSETKASTPFQFSYANPSVLYVPHRKFEKEFSGTTGSAALQYRWNPSVMTYASWAQGFKSGGFNSRFNGVVAANAPPSFNQETADSREAGIKLDFERMRINVAVFTTTYEDLQFTYRIGTAPFLFNAGEASIDGAELEFKFIPTSNIVLEGGLGYLDAGIDKVSTIVGATTAVTTHSKLPYTPKLQGNLALGYSFDIGAAARATPRIEAIYTAQQYFDAGNTAEISQVDSTTLLNMGVTFESVQGWTLALGVNNVGGKIFPIAGNSSLTSNSGYAEIAYNRGREAFASFSKEF
jgi:iron complex outermembrane receptor protein